MMEFLNKLKQKPEHVRKRIAFFTTLGIFAVIVNVWWISWQTPVTDNSIVMTEVASPLGVVADMIFGLKDDAEHIANTLKDQLQQNGGGAPEGQTASVAESDQSNTPDNGSSDRSSVSSSTREAITPEATDSN